MVMSFIKNFFDKKSKLKDKNRFYKALGVNPDASPEEVNSAIINFVSDDNNADRLYILRLTEEQLADNSYMMSLYRANPELTKMFVPNDEKKKDTDFLLEYLKLKDSVDKYIFDYFEYGKLKSEFKNPEFVEKFISTFPEKNIVSVLDKVFPGYSISKGTDKKEVINAISTEKFVQQVQTFGLEILNNLPNTRVDYVTLVDAAIEGCGFGALKGLSPEQIIDNKELVVKAYEHTSIGELITYFTRTISPHRSISYVCHDEPHYDNYYDHKYADIREQLLADNDISKIFKDNNVDMQISYEQIQHLKAVKEPQQAEIE